MFYQIYTFALGINEGEVCLEGEKGKERVSDRGRKGRKEDMWMKVSEGGKEARSGGGRVRHTCRNVIDLPRHA